VSGGFTFASIRAGFGFTCGLTTGGVAYCWGQNEMGQLGIGSNADALTPVKVLGQP
jgi:alpha-tubulin suppressor-like RCC1 family protein